MIEGGKTLCWNETEVRPKGRVRLPLHSYPPWTGRPHRQTSSWVSWRSSERAPFSHIRLISSLAGRPSIHSTLSIYRCLSIDRFSGHGDGDGADDAPGEEISSPDTKTAGGETSPSFLPTSLGLGVKSESDKESSSLLTLCGHVKTSRLRSRFSPRLGDASVPSWPWRRHACRA